MLLINSIIMSMAKFKNTQELINWLNRTFQMYKIKEDQRMLSRFIAESQSGKLSDEILRWWVNRY